MHDSYIVAITGASGAIIGVRLIEELLKSGRSVAAVVSDAGRRTLAFEILREAKKNASVSEILEKRGCVCKSGFFSEYANDDFFSPPASGTSGFKAVIVVPASMKSLSAIANGYADSLITRAADVAIKERRRLILVPRETPLSSIHLENMLRVRNVGGDILMPVPGFYTFPETISDVVDFTVGRVLSLLDIPHTLYRGWGDHSGEDC